MSTPASPSGPKSPDQQYEQFLREGRFMIQRCRSTGEHVFYPRVAAPLTGSTDLEWVPASGLGTVYSVTVIRVRPPKPSYNVCLIDLDEGPRMMSRVESISPEAVRIGMRVQAFIGCEGDQPIVLFNPLEGACA